MKNLTGFKNFGVSREIGSKSRGTRKAEYLVLREKGTTINTAVKAIIKSCAAVEQCGVSDVTGYFFFILIVVRREEW